MRAAGVCFAEMFDASTLVAFAVASLALLVLPGPSVMYVVALSLQRGRLAGIVSVLGVGVGAYLQFVAAALGLAALLTASSMAFAVVKWAGAIYLVYLGIRTWREPDGALLAPSEVSRSSLQKIALQGTLVTILNPKLALFVLAFVPQFLDPAGGSVAVQVLLLGALFVALAAVTDSLYALSAGWLGAQLRAHPAAPRIQRWFSGAVYIALGVTAAATGSNQAASTS